MILSDAMQNPKLIIFNLDGTLVRPFTDELLPEVTAWFSVARWQMPKLAIATNQGSVAMWYHMRDTRPGQAHKYPSPAEAESRVWRVAARLGIERPLVYMSFAYRFQNTSQWIETPFECALDMRWSRNWRKPNPGMINQALRDLELLPNEGLMVGNHERDRLAAVAAGVPFQRCGEFFRQPQLAFAV